jgi:hypothetical protein
MNDNNDEKKNDSEGESNSKSKIVDRSRGVPNFID